MKLNPAGKSLLLLGLSILIWITLTLFESSLVGMPPGVERAVALLLLVLPAAAGSVVGVMSLVRRDGPRWLAFPGAVLNALFALFHLAVVLFGG